MTLKIFFSFIDKVLIVLRIELKTGQTTENSNSFKNHLLLCSFD